MTLSCQPRLLCLLYEKVENSCFALHDYFSSVGFVPDIDHGHCLVFDEDAFLGNEISSIHQKRIEEFCRVSLIVFFS